MLLPAAPTRVVQPAQMRLCSPTPTVKATSNSIGSCSVPFRKCYSSIIANRGIDMCLSGTQRHSYPHESDDPLASSRPNLACQLLLHQPRFTILAWRISTRRTGQLNLGLRENLTFRIKRGRRAKGCMQSRGFRARIEDICRTGASRVGPSTRCQSVSVGQTHAFMRFLGRWGSESWQCADLARRARMDAADTAHG